MPIDFLDGKLALSGFGCQDDACLDSRDGLWLIRVSALKACGRCKGTPVQIRGGPATVDGRDTCPNATGHAEV